MGRYLPHVVPDEVRRWLTRGIVAGEGTNVRLRIRGDLRNFPFVNPATGQFQVTAHIEKGVLDYAADWPRIEPPPGRVELGVPGRIVDGTARVAATAEIPVVVFGSPRIVIGDHVVGGGSGRCGHLIARRWDRLDQIHDLPAVLLKANRHWICCA